MALQVVWTNNAFEDYRRVIDYLLIGWPLKVASDFITIVEERVDTLGSFPNLVLFQQNIHLYGHLLSPNTTNSITVYMLTKLK